jgi:DNA-directed RNA polymerase III subunit RPC1
MLTYQRIHGSLLKRPPICFWLAERDILAWSVYRLADDLHPLRAVELFEAIIPEDIDVLDIGCRPEDLICRVLAVPPVAIRPSVEMDGASNEDDITMKLMVG